MRVRCDVAKCNRIVHRLFPFSARGMPTVELRFQFRYAAALPPRLLTLDTDTLWFEPASGSAPALSSARLRVIRPTFGGCSNFRPHPFQSTASADHDSIGMLAPHGATRHPARLPGGFPHQ